MVGMKKGENMIEPGTVVKNKISGAMGVVVKDSFGVCDGEETAVIYEGTLYSVGTETSHLEVIGKENPKADLKKCGAGKGKERCIFLGIGPNGPQCKRFSSLRGFLLSKRSDMIAKRVPTKLFPKCQLEE